MSPESSSLPPLPEDERVLLLLGLLTEQDRHGYEINDFIEHTLHNVIRLNKATAYQLLDRLEQHGFVASRLEQHGQRPNRKVYHLTLGGQEKFQAMLAAQLAAEEPLILTGNVPVMFSEHLPRPEALAALRTRLQELEQRLAAYEAMRLPCTAGVGLALDRIYHLTRADRDWLAGVVARMAKEEETAEMTQGDTKPTDE